MLANAFHIQLIEPARRSAEQPSSSSAASNTGKRLSRMCHSAGGVNPRSDAEGHVARIRLGWIGARGSRSNSCSPLRPRSGENSARPSLARVLRTMQQRGTQSPADGSDRCIRRICTRTTDARPSYRSARLQRERPSETSRPARSAKRIGPVLPSWQPTPGCGGDRSRRRRFSSLCANRTAVPQR